MLYRIEATDDLFVLKIFDAIDPNRFSIRDRKHTQAEKDAYNARKAANTPEQNLRELFDEAFMLKWKATELYHWCEANCPGYQVRRSGFNDAYIQFTHMSQVLLFKLTWAGA